MRRFFVPSVLFLFPLAVFAADATDIVAVIAKLISDATPVVVGLAVLFFLYGLALYILASGDEAKRNEGRHIMIWGIIALFAMVSVWGLVKILQNTLNINQGAAPQVKPLIPTS